MITKPNKEKYPDQIIYLDDSHNIVSPDNATLIKVYKDGKIIFLVPDKTKNAN